VVFALLCSGAASGAQTTPPPQAPAPPEISANEIQRWFDAYALVQAQDALQLSEAQYGKFVTRIKLVQELRRRNQQARGRILQELRRLTAPDIAVDEGAVREQLRMLREVEDRNTTELRKAYEAVDELLDVRQQARFRLFEEQMERKKLELLMRARRSAAAQNGRRGRGSQN
jgi:hypothetical protein